jgi:hypothetical protein
MDDNSSSSASEVDDTPDPFHHPTLPSEAWSERVTEFMEFVKSRCSCNNGKHVAQMRQYNEMFRRIAFEALGLSLAARRERIFNALIN